MSRRRFSAPGNHSFGTAPLETGKEPGTSHPKMMSGFGMEGWEERKEMMVLA